MTIRYGCVNMIYERVCFENGCEIFVHGCETHEYECPFSIDGCRLKTYGCPLQINGWGVKEIYLKGSVKARCYYGDSLSVDAFTHRA